MNEFKIYKAINDQGAVWLIKAQSPQSAAAWLCGNPGLMGINPRSIVEATPDDLYHHLAMGARIHTTNDRQYREFLASIGAMALDEHQAAVESLRRSLESQWSQPTDSESQLPPGDPCLDLPSDVDDSAGQS